MGDRKGLSYYPYDKISDLLRISVDDYITARNDLIHKDLIAFDGRLFQVLSLPQNPVGEKPRPITHMDEMKPQGSGHPSCDASRGAIPMTKDRFITMDQVDLRFLKLRSPTALAIKNMADSLKKQGQLTPVVLTGEERPYILIDGFKRYLAAQSLDWNPLKRFLSM